MMVLIIFLCSFISNEVTTTKIPAVVKIIDPTNIPNKPFPLQKKIVLPAKQITKSVMIYPPKIVIDKLVLDLVENKDIEDAQIGLKTTAGNIDDVMPGPAMGINGSDVPASVAKAEDKIFFEVEIDATFKGDWKSYVKKEIENTWMS